MVVGNADMMARDGAAASEEVTAVGFMLVEHFSMIAFSSAVEPLRLANRAARRELYCCSLWSENGQSCTHQGVVRGRDARAHGRQAPGGTWLRAALGAPAAFQNRRPDPRGFQTNLAARVAEILPEPARDKPLEVWFQDEARVGQQGTPTRVRARKGTRPRAPRDQRYKWTYLFGAACPARGTSAALVLPTVNTEMMSLHLAEISKQVAPGSHAVLVLDGAGYHGTAKTRRPHGLVVPDNITLLHLPEASPELTPMELVWQYLRQNKLANRIFRDYRQIVDACCDAWNFFADNPGIVTSITARDWVQIKL
ncbi:IS630 family transposase [Methylobacterium frigidaeris]|uniref:Tc1-like transposase DDE domain-containing protein n=1 Tax=Methylobacterium frigidaeris TaxID=2038277 RepID=A0AA37M2Z1_9HYPH|nr:hypothetical protein CS379_23580 [Methylobacterium frigidaeris]GJD60802.1 hypothetical protein MPEAHAMD_0941 [Methylobacterium frigidaeris]